MQAAYNNIKTAYDGRPNPNGLRPTIVIAGSSRGALIALGVAEKLAKDDGITVDLVAMYDPVDMSEIDDKLGENIPAKILQVAVVGGVKQADKSGNLDYWNTDSRRYDWERTIWDNQIRRASGNAVTDVNKWEMDASHGAIVGLPGYNDNFGNPEPDDNSGEGELAPYDYEKDKTNSKEADRWIRATIRALGINLRAELTTDYPYPENNPVWKP